MQQARWWLIPAFLIVAGCTSGPVTPSEEVASPNTEAPPGLSPSAVAATTPTASPTAALATPSAVAAGGDLPGLLFHVVTEDLVVRSRPGTGSDSEIYPALLSAPTIVYVIDGPEVADGYAWYLVDVLALPCIIGCDAAPRPGWVAAAGKDGERWLSEVPVAYDCPEPTLEQLSGTYPHLRLNCFIGEELTLTGVVGSEETDGGPPGWQWGWPWQHSVALYGPDYPGGPITGCADACPGPLLTVAFEGTGGLPSPGNMTRVTGHFDGAKADECRSDDRTVDQRIAAHMCRMVFVATTWD
jgi:hypothetical protein